MVLFFGAAVAGLLPEIQLRLVVALELNYVLKSTREIGYFVDFQACHGIVFVCQRLKGRAFFITWIHGAQEVAHLC